MRELVVEIKPDGKAAYYDGNTELAIFASENTDLNLDNVLIRPTYEKEGDANI